MCSTQVKVTRGRPVLWGLAVGGEVGARHVLEILRDELDLAMALSGPATVADIDASLVVRRREVAGALDGSENLARPELPSTRTEPHSPSMSTS